MNNKNLFSNSIYNILYKLLNVIFPLISSIYASRILQPSGIGMVSSAQNIVTYFTLIAALGIPTYGVKEIAKNHDNNIEKNRTFSELISINFISTTICAIAYYVMIFGLPYFENKRILYCVVGINIVFNYFNVDWFYQGTEEYKYIMIRSFLVKVISFLSIILFVKQVNDYILYTFINCCALGLNYLLNVIRLFKKAKLSLKNINLKRHLKPVLFLLLTSISIEIYVLIDTTMLTFLFSEEIVGYYSTSTKIISTIRTLVISMCGVFLPKLSYYYSNNNIDKFNKLIQTGFKVILLFSVPAAIGTFMVADYAIPILFGSQYNDAILTTKIFSLSIITVAFSNFIGYQVLVTIGQEKKVFISTIIGAVLNICLNSIMIPIMKHNGAAIASVLTELSVTVIQIVFMKKYVKIKIASKFILKEIVCLFVMITTVYLSISLIQNDFMKFVISIVSGLAVYIIFSFIVKQDIFNDFLIKLKRGKKNEKDINYRR